MGKRFGRNQRRQWRDALALAERQIAADKARHTALIQQMRKDFDEFAAQCRVIDQRGHEIVVDVTAIARERDMEIELMTKLRSSQFDQLNYALRVDPFRDIRRDRDNFVRVVGAKVGQAFAAYIARLESAAEW